MTARKGPRTAVKPVVWQPPTRPDRAKRRTGNIPIDVEVIGLPGNGGEDVLIDEDGSVLTGIDDGRILRIWPDGRAVFEVADTGGRPLGLEFHPAGGLVVCDADLGLLRVSPEDWSV